MGKTGYLTVKSSISIKFPLSNWPLQPPLPLILTAAILSTWNKLIACAALKEKEQRYVLKNRIEAVYPSANRNAVFKRWLENK